MPMTAGSARRRVQVLQRSSELLSRYLPILRFDAGERYFPLAAEAWTDCPGHLLRRTDGTILAGAEALSLAFLGPHRYRNGSPVLAGDAIVSPGRRYPAKA